MEVYFDLDEPLKRLRQGNENIGIRKNAFEVLLYLVKCRDRVVSPQNLSNFLWPNSTVFPDDGVKRCIADIRKALGDQAKASKFIKTNRGYGYQFIGAVEEMAAGIWRLRPRAETGQASPTSDFDIRPSHSYPERSTFLDKHLIDVRKIAATRILACNLGFRGGEQRSSTPPTPDEFFYDQTIRLFVDSPVREQREQTEPRRLEEVILDGWDDPSTPRQFLLLGEGGAGKSTALFKLFFDCVSTESPSPLQGRVTPWLVRLGLLRNEWRREPQSITLEGFLDWLASEIKWDTRTRGRMQPENLRTELDRSPRLLLLLDGLDEIQPDLQDTRDAIADVLRKFFALCSATCVVATARKSEIQRPWSLLIAPLFDAWSRVEVAELAWSADEIQAYTQRVDLSSKEADARLALLGSDPRLLRNPMLLYLFAIADLKELQGKALTRPLLYRAAMRTCLKEEVNKRTFPFDMPEAPVDVLIKLLGILAVGMKKQGQTFLEETDAVEIFRAFIREHPDHPSWWPLVQNGNRKGKALGYGDREEIQELVKTLQELFLFL